MHGYYVNSPASHFGIMPVYDDSSFYAALPGEPQ